MTKADIAADQQQVSGDKRTLAKAAVNKYINSGRASRENPIFSGNQDAAGAKNEYNESPKATHTAVDKLHTAENQLNAQEAQLTTSSQAQTQVNAEQAAVAAERSRPSTSQKAHWRRAGSDRPVVQQQQQQRSGGRRARPRAEAGRRSGGRSGRTGSRRRGRRLAAGQRRYHRLLGAPGGAGAVQAAESQLGVPYSVGRRDPPARQSGFDCSGLTAWSWGQVGVGLPPLGRPDGRLGAGAPQRPAAGRPPLLRPRWLDHVAMYVSPRHDDRGALHGCRRRLTGLAWVTASSAPAGHSQADLRSAPRPSLRSSVLHRPPATSAPPRP